MSQPTETIRLDQLLLNAGLVASRSRARDAISRGTVRVDGRIVTKPSSAFPASATIETDDPAQAYVSRAALKLKAALDAFGLDPAGLDCLDIGASTGGFTEILLERGASHVVAVDVGHGQLHPRLAADARVTSHEGLNARVLDADHLDGRAIGAVVSDVSFISLKLALPPALELARPGSHALLLVKPQFEAGREAIGKGGLLKNPADAEIVAAALREWLDGLAGWRALGLCPSPIEGGDGNREFLLAGVKDR